MLLESRSLWKQSLVPVSSSKQSMIWKVSGLSMLGQFLLCGWCLASPLASHQRCYGRRHGRIRCSVSCIEVAMHLKLQYSALSGPAGSSAHFGVRVQSAVAYHIMLSNTTSLSCRLGSP